MIKLKKNWQLNVPIHIPLCLNKFSEFCALFTQLCFRDSAKFEYTCYCSNFIADFSQLTSLRF
jgi:hypothetical protein